MVARYSFQGRWFDFYAHTDGHQDLGKSAGTTENEVMASFKTVSHCPIFDDEVAIVVKRAAVERQILVTGVVKNVDARPSRKEKNTARRVRSEQCLRLGIWLKTFK